MPASTTAVEATDLVLAHGDHVALARSSLRIERGRVVCCIGPNGSGKSSLLDAISGLLPVRGGRLEVLGGPPGRGGVAHVVQSTEMPDHLPLTVREVVTMGLYRRLGLLRPVRAAERAEIDRAMERTGVQDLASRQLLELSGGQRQRALVAQGLVAGADLLVLDEPMTGLDVVSRRGVLAVIDEERRAGRTVLFSTHDLSEARVADVVVLLAGRIVAVGPPARVLVEENLVEAYRGRLVQLGSVGILDDPHHHGRPEDRHDGHVH